MTRRYVVLTEGREDIRGIIVVPGAVRPRPSGGYVPVTLGYKHNLIIGRASDFQRAGVIDGECKITFNVEFTDPNYDHDVVQELGLTPGVFINRIFTYQPDPSNKLKHLTDGDICEISFYDARPPDRIKLEG